MSDVIYKFLSPEFALRVLEQYRLKVSILQELNDIFDCAPVIPPTGDEPSYLGYWPSQIVLEKSYETYGLLCFSKTFRSPLLWGHYAASAKGLALGFDPEHFLWKDPIEVTYKDKSRPVLLVPAGNYPFPVLERQAVRTCFGKKAEEWGYEQEVRYLVELGTCEPVDGLYFSPFPRLALREIIIGCKSPIKPTYVRHSLETHYADIGVKLYTASAHPNLYEITKQEVPCILPP